MYRLQVREIPRIDIGGDRTIDDIWKRCRSLEQLRKDTSADLGLASKRVVISGASRGIGRTIAEAFLREGAVVGICARGMADLTQAASELSAGGAPILHKAFDVCGGAALADLVNEAAAAMGGLDAVVVNASAPLPSGPSPWGQSFETDLMSLVHFIEIATPHLATASGGSIIYISTTATIEAGPTITATTSYAALKTAGVQHAGAQVRLLGQQGIRVNVVSPGPIYFEGGGWDAVREARPETNEAFLAQEALGKMGTGDDVANAVVFLSSPTAGHITGVNLVVGGGLTKRFDF